MPNLEDLTDRKKAYFIRIGLQMRKALQLHKEAELWERKEGKRDWGNVSEHCLVEVARTDVFADLLALPDDMKGDLRLAAALHDFFKKSEKEIVTKGALSWESFGTASQEAALQLQAAGFSEKIIHLTGATGHEAFIEAERLAGTEILSPEEVAYLVLHYVDNYTRGSAWAIPAERTPEGKPIKNELERRAEMNEENPRYAQLNEEGRPHFGGKTTFEAQRCIGNLVEQRLARLIQERGGLSVEPKDLPEFVDKEIKKRIQARKS